MDSKKAIPANVPRIPIRLCLRNNPFRLVTDQVEFFCCTMASHGYRVTISNSLDANSLNFVIENFNEPTFGYYLNFHKRHRKRIGIIVTEHVNWNPDGIRFHGVKLDDPDDYIDPGTKKSRLIHLMLSTEFASGYFTLGDLPQLRGFGSLMTGTEVFRLPFPTIKAMSVESPHYDLLWSGARTEYRDQILLALEQSCRVQRQGFSSRRIRTVRTQSSKFVLNVPQNARWPWVSTMRVLAGLRAGRATISIGTQSDDVMDRFCIAAKDIAALASELPKLLEDYDRIYRDIICRYNSYASSSSNYPFPYGTLQLWALRELA